MSYFTQTAIKHISSTRLKLLRRRLGKLYGMDRADRLLDRMYQMIGRYGVGVGLSPNTGPSGLSQQDVVLISYADMVQAKDRAPLEVLRQFCTQRLKGAISTIHFLPFYPWTSDDGFSVVDYRQVHKDYGSWSDIEKFADDFQLMFDLVLNHCSSKSPWFKEFVSGVEPGMNYIMMGDPESDLTTVVRPRSSPLLTPYQTRGGEKMVWTTFSADQVDLDWTCPDLLFEFLDIILFYISMGCRVLRLDAVAFLWKKMGTNCLHLPETHEVIKLIRNFVEVVAPETILLTETNVPHEENISYFGKGDEAHAVYQFSLPPLLLHGLLRGTSKHMREWATQLSPPPKGCHFLNFTASHDGVGVRPLEGILPSQEVLSLAKEIESKGGKVSMRSLADGSDSPYELNVTYYSALSDPNQPELGEARFLCSQALALSLQGIPAIYFHSLCATPNDQDGFAETGRARTLNRKKWQLSELDSMLDDENTTGSRVFDWFVTTLRKRASAPAFHPDASQEILNLGDSLFGLIRSSIDGNQSIVCLYNFLPSSSVVKPMKEIKKRFPQSKARDLISGGEIDWGTNDLELRPYQAVWLLSH
ncbi:sugar phosphorylase [Opitutales bacterium]|nr:sugar phosphorylase [Opitutales bacterium]